LDPKVLWQEGTCMMQMNFSVDKGFLLETLSKRIGGLYKVDSPGLIPKEKDKIFSTLKA
jgi:hypothetical protein